MAAFNRVKFQATINSLGQIVPGDAVAGFRTFPSPLWQYVNETTGVSYNSSKQGVHQYLLEDAAGGWELGYVTVDVVNGPGTRTPVDTNVFFDATSVGLVMSMTGTAANGIGCSPTAPQGKANQTSIALGGYAQVKHNVDESVALGAGAYVEAVGGTALGSKAVAYQDGETAIGSGSTFRLMPINWSGGVDESGTPFTSNQSNTLNLAQWDIAAHPASRREGVMRVRGTLVVFDDDVGMAANNTKVYDLDYLAFISPSAGTSTLLGAPTITVRYTGGADPGSSITIDVATGIPVLTTAAVALYSYGLLEIHDFQTHPSSSGSGFDAAVIPSGGAGGTSGGV